MPTMRTAAATIMCSWLVCQHVVATNSNNEFLQRLFTELQLPHVAANFHSALSIAWDLSSLQPQASPETLHCFNQPTDGIRENRWHAQLAIATARLQPRAKGTQQSKTDVTGRACTGSRCLIQKIGDSRGSSAALMNVTDLLLLPGITSWNRTAQQLCLQVQLLEPVAADTGTPRPPALHSAAVLLVYDGTSAAADDTAAGLSRLLAGARRAIIATATAEAAALRRLQQEQHGPPPPPARRRSEQQAQGAAAAAALPVPEQRRRRSGGHAMPAGACSLREWVVHYDQLPASYHDSPYFPRVQRVNYCAGSCASRTPYSSLNFSTNSFLRTLPLGDGATGTLIPQPCCVPVAYHSVPVAYLERSGMVRIEQRTDLMVRACGCR